MSFERLEPYESKGSRTVLRGRWHSNVLLLPYHLPAELRAVCDLSTLKLESGSFVEDDLRQYFSDVLYSLKTTAGDGYIHVLVKHLCKENDYVKSKIKR